MDVERGETQNSTATSGSRYTTSSGSMNERGQVIGYNPVEAGRGFSEKEIRQKFIAKVYSILTVQLIVTSLIVATIISTESLKDLFVRKAPWLYLVFSFCAFVPLLIFCCVPGAIRNYPLNIILLGVFTVFEGLSVGGITARYSPYTVGMAVGLTVACVLSLTLIAWFAPFDITSWGPILCVLLCIQVFISLGSVIIIYAFGLKEHYSTVHLVICYLGLFLFMIYLVYDTQLIVGKGRYSLGPEDYIAGALALYLDIVNIFVYLLMILGGGGDRD